MSKEVSVGGATFFVEGDEIMAWGNGSGDNGVNVAQNLWKAICELQVDMNVIDLATRGEGPSRRLHSVLRKNDRPLAWAALEAAGERV